MASTARELLEKAHAIAATRIAEAQVGALEDMGLAARMEEFRDCFNARLIAGGDASHLGALANPA